MKFMRSVLILILFMIPLLLLSQDQDPKVKPADDENLVEVKTLQDLIQEKEIEEKKEPETKQEQTEKKEPVKDPEIKEQPKDEKKEPEIKEIKKEPADQKTSTKKPLKIPKQKESNPNIFNGKLSQEDILVEKKGNTHILWIKKKAQVFSAALISPSQWKIKGQYFLRSPKLIKEQKDNTLWYKGLPIGNNKKLYFLASSSTEKHPLLGKSFKIILPSKVTYGYDKKTGEKDIIPGKTYITIRLFKKPQGQGGSGDNLFLIPKIETKPITQPEVSIQQKQTKVHLFGISFVYHSLTPDIKRITLETDKEELLFHDFQKNLTYKKYFQIVQWGYNKDSKTFKMKFIMILNIKKNKNFVLKIKDSKGTLTLPIDVNQLLTQPDKKEEIQIQEPKKQEEKDKLKEENKEPSKDKEKTDTETQNQESKKETEKKDEVKTEPKKEDEVKVEVLKNEPSDDLNLKVQE